MVIRCSECNKVRKFGTWIEVHPVLAEQMKGANFYYMHCPNCEAPSLTQELIQRTENKVLKLLALLFLRR